MRSVSSTPTLMWSGYWNSGLSRSRSGHCSSGGRLSRVNVSTCADGPSPALPFLTGLRSLLNAVAEDGSRDNHFLNIGGSFVNPERPDLAIKLLDGMPDAHAVAAVELHGRIDHALCGLCC